MTIEDRPPRGVRAIFEWLFRNRITGEITIGQFPNLSIALFALAYGVHLFVAGPVGFWAGIGSRVFLAWWAADELLRGVNPWRRMLGAGVLVYLAVVVLRGLA